jgi:lysophospholipase L1-like esterase
MLCVSSQHPSADAHRRHVLIRLVFGVLLIVGLALLADRILERPQQQDLPRSMSALGDSITRAFNIGDCCVLRDAPDQSWATGLHPQSHYRRLVDLEPRIQGNVTNFARSGARISDLPRQMAAAISERAEYVTIQIGANDICASDATAGSAIADLEATITTSLDTYVAAIPAGRILLTSTPNLHRLWEIFRDNRRATATWQLFGICPAMLSMLNTDDDRQRTIAFQQALNSAMERACSQHRQCQWDDYVVYNDAFEARHVSDIDFFHPSAAGQQRLAQITWHTTPWSLISDAVGTVE